LGDLVVVDSHHFLRGVVQSARQEPGRTWKRKTPHGSPRRKRTHP
jgi:hypothetical protein